MMSNTTSSSIQLISYISLTTFLLSSLVAVRPVIGISQQPSVTAASASISAFVDNKFPPCWHTKKYVLQRHPSPAFMYDRKNNLLQMSSLEEVDICIIGGGVSGLSAARHAAAASTTQKNIKILLLEATPTLGGRVQTDTTSDGYSLDRGFAVFIDAYPQNQNANLNEETLKLGSFEPGALVVLEEGNGYDEATKIARVADPLKRPNLLLAALTSPVGTFLDKLRLFPLLFYIRTNTIEQIFQNNPNPNETTKACLKKTYGFSEEFINQFFAPFFEGIFFCSLEEQSSNMFHFVFKMFNEGSATLPRGGIGSVSDKLVENAKHVGSDNLQMEVNSAVSKMSLVQNEKKGGDRSFQVELKDGKKKKVCAKSVILATEETNARKILSNSFKHFKSKDLEEKKDEPTKRSVGAIYYGFDSDLPMSEPILIINGMRGATDDDVRHPINNVCFPSAVADGYAPKGCHLCCVSIPGSIMDEYRGKHDDLDEIVRTKLALWFPKYAQDIQTKWECKGVYHIENAQPVQLNVPYPATVHGGRDCKTFRGKALPEGLFVCGDHVATATLNGALESGVNAGKEAAKYVQICSK